jgi:hypothetical protein
MTWNAGPASAGITGRHAWNPHGALGSVLYGVFSELMQVHSGSINLNARTWPVLFHYPTIYVYGLVITAAVGNRWRGP